MQKVKEFYEALAKDREMQERAQVMGDEKPASEDDALAAVLEFAGKEGYNFTAEALKEYLESQKAVQLTDEELEQVAAGGISPDGYGCFCLVGGGGKNVNGSCVCVIGGCGKDDGKVVMNCALCGDS